MKKILIILILLMLSAPFINTMELKKVLEIGSNEREDYIFFQTGPIMIDKYGNIYALEGETQVIRKYDKTGKFVKKTGSKGQGPLEFMAITSMAIQDERLLVYDFGNKSVTV